MATALADKIKKTENAFPAQNPGAVTACPYAALPAAEEQPLPVELKTSFALTQDILGASSSSAARQTEQQKEKKAWIEIVLVDMEGKPVPGVRYRIKMPDGEVQEGRLNEHGQAGYYQIEPGTCKVTFPDLDKDVWE